jgi:hypothetical protein
MVVQYRLRNRWQSVRSQSRDPAIYCILFVNLNYMQNRKAKERWENEKRPEQYAKSRAKWEGRMPLSSKFLDSIAKAQISFRSLARSLAYS